MAAKTKLSETQSKALKQAASLSHDATKNVSIIQTNYSSATYASLVKRGLLKYPDYGTTGGMQWWVKFTPEGIDYARSQGWLTAPTEAQQAAPVASADSGEAVDIGDIFDAAVDKLEAKLAPLTQDAEGKRMAREALNIIVEGLQHAAQPTSTQAGGEAVSDAKPKISGGDFVIYNGDAYTVTHANDDSRYSDTPAYRISTGYGLLAGTFTAEQLTPATVISTAELDALKAEIEHLKRDLAQTRNTLNYVERLLEEANGHNDIS